MKTNEKTRSKAKSSGRKTGRLFDKMKKSDMTVIDRKIHDLLIADGYRAVSAGRIKESGFNNDLNVNNMEYIRGERERVFVITHKPVGRGK